MCKYVKWIKTQQTAFQEEPLSLAETLSKKLILPERKTKSLFKTGILFRVIRIVITHNSGARDETWTRRARRAGLAALERPRRSIHYRSEFKFTCTKKHSPSKRWTVFFLVREMRLELTRRLTHAPQTCLSTYSSTLASALKAKAIIHMRGALVKNDFSAFLFLPEYCFLPVFDGVFLPVVPAARIENRSQ